MSSSASSLDLDGATLDVLVVAYYSESTLSALLRSVADHLPTGARIGIWANSDPAPLERFVKGDPAARDVDVRILGDGENLGFARACNALAEWSDREHLLFLNPDAAVESWPAHLNVAPGRVVAPIVLNSTSEPQESYGSERTLYDEFAIRLLRRGPQHIRSQTSFRVGFVSGAAFLVRRDEFLEVGGLDCDYFMYYEDIDFGNRWAMHGGECWVEPAWVVKHIGGASANTDRLSALQRSQLSAERYHARWSGGVMVFRVICLVEAFVKAVISLIAGRVGTVDRRTQFNYARWLLRGSRAPN